VERNTNSWKAEARLYAPGFVELQGFAAGTRMVVHAGRKTFPQAVDDRGLLTVPLEHGLGEWTEVSVGP
jgi:hypothetical protein